MLANGTLVSDTNPMTSATRYLDLGQCITGGAVAAGAYAYSPVFTGLGFVRYAQYFIQSDQLGRVTFFHEVLPGVFCWGQTMFNMATISTSSWQPASGIPSNGSTLSTVLGGSGKFAFNNTAATPTTVANVVIKLFGG